MIIKKANYMETIMKHCLVLPNVYKIYTYNAAIEERGKRILRMEETPSCPARCFTTPYCRPYKGVIKSADRKLTFVDIVREFTCTCCCLGRPTAMMFHSISKKFFGKVVVTFGCP